MLYTISLKYEIIILPQSSFLNFWQLSSTFYKSFFIWHNVLSQGFELLTQKLWQVMMIILFSRKLISKN